MKRQKDRDRVYTKFWSNIFVFKKEKTTCMNISRIFEKHLYTILGKVQG